VPIVVAATGGPSSSKPKQRNRKGKERDLPPESGGTNSIQIVDAPQESQRRKSNGRKPRGKKGDSEVTGRDAEEPEKTASAPPSAASSKKPRPKARPLNKAKAQPHANPGTSSRLQNTDEIQTTTSEATAVKTVESARASSLLTQGSANEESEEDTQQLSRKRLIPALPESHYADKRRKSKYVFLHLRVLADTT
jgi:hypothetical protein